MGLFTDAAMDEQNVTQTENGAKTLKTSKSLVLDFFSKAGAVRALTDSQKIGLFSSSFAEDRLLTLKALFYFRDIRGGQGERALFRTVLNFIGKNHPEVLKDNLSLISEYGRWDDILSLIGTSLEDQALSLYATQLKKDFELATSKGKVKSISLAGKWAPSLNTSSKATVAQGQKLSRALHFSPKQYRILLSTLRKHLRVVEILMTANKWSEIEFSQVPSNAMKLYKGAFRNHQASRFSDFLDKVKTGETKINSSTLYPYDIIKPILRADHEHNYNIKNLDPQVMEAQWNALPNYILEDSGNTLVMADTSGSMVSPECQPIATSISLAMYFADRNTGPFAGHFMTFSGKPDMVKITGKTIIEKVRNINKANWNQNTNLQAAFDLILRVGQNSNLSASEMPKRILIVSDMQFDEANGRFDTNFDVLKQKYQDSGYELPLIVFWDVNARTGQSPVKRDTKGTMLVSGSSPSIFKAVMESKVVTPYDLMLEVLNSERYEKVKI